MRIQQLSVPEALQSLHSSPEGLSDAEARRRLLEFGPNRIERLPREPLPLRFLQEFTHFFALILWIAAALAFYAAWRQPGAGMGTLGAAIIGVILINGLFSFWQQYRAEKALQALQKLLPQMATVRREGRTVQVPAEELAPGDILLLEEGDSISADCRLIAANTARVSNATLTGESQPLSRDAAPYPDMDLIHSRNIVLAGTALLSGSAEGLVFATGMRTEFGKIAHLTQTTGETLSPLQREIRRLSRLIAILSSGIGASFFALGWLIGIPFWANLIFAIGVIVALVPEGLLPTVTLSMAIGSQRMARRNALIRHLPAVEALGAATVICTDKTGTLTENHMTATDLYLGGSLYPAAEAAPLAEPFRAFFQVGRHCHNLKAVTRAGRTEWLGDPMETALLELAVKYLPAVEELPRVDEIPFDSERKRLSTIHQGPEGHILFTKGAPENVLPLCTRIKTAQGELPLTPEWRARISAAQEEMASRGRRVLAFACRQLPAETPPDRRETDLLFLGLVGLEDPPRPEVPDAIAVCRRAGIQVILLTGDYPTTAVAIARQIGLVQSDSPRIITGEQLQHLSDTQLQLALGTPEILFARVGPGDKLRIVRALIAKRHTVAVTGDGVNDAPALKAADIGIAMGKTGTDVAREAADMVLLDDNFASIVAAVEEGRGVFANVRKFLTYILASNMPELVPYLCFVLLHIPLPLTVLQILAVDLGADMLPAIALGAERPDRRIMERPPRARTEHLFDGTLAARAFLFLGMIESVAAMTAYFFTLHAAGWRWGQIFAAGDPRYQRATAATLSAIIVMQMVNVFLCRGERESAFSFPLRGNLLILWGIAVEIGILLVLDYTRCGNIIFNTAPLPAAVWGFLLPFALGLLLLEELRKWWLRRKESLAANERE